MPARKKKLKKPSPKGYKSKFTAQKALGLWFKRTLFILIPVFAVFAAFGILQSSLISSSPSESLVADAETAHSMFYSFNPTEKLGLYQGQQVQIPANLNQTLSQAASKNSVLGDTTGGEKWIEVSLSQQKLIAHDGDQVFLESLVSTGIPGRDTPVGEFRVWYKIQSTKMEGGEGKSHYYLPNVPFVMFFQNDQVPGYKGYSLHGTYWHKNFGHKMSHGCVNLPTPIAQKLYDWTTPTLADGKRIALASDSNPGTRIVIHQ